MNLLLAVLLGVAEMAGHWQMDWSADPPGAQWVEDDAPPPAAAAQPKFQYIEMGDTPRIINDPSEATPGAMVVTQGVLPGATNDQANTWVSLSGAAPGPNGAPPADAQVTPWNRPTDDGSGIGNSILGQRPFQLGAAVATLGASGALGAADAIQPGVFGGQTLAGAAGGAIAGGAGSAAAGSAIRTSNDTPGEPTIAPGVVNPGVAPGTDQSGLGSGLGGAAATGAASAGSAAALQRILAGGGTAADYAAVLGAAAPGVLGAVASNNQTQAYKDLAEKNMAFGAPSRARYEASMSPSFDPSTIPGYTAALDNSAQAILRKLSTSGNPYGSPGALIEANKAVVAGTAMPAIRDYQLLNSSSGGLSTTTPAGNTSANNAIASNGNTWNSLGAATAAATAPPAFNLADYFRNLTSGSGNNYALA